MPITRRGLRMMTGVIAGIAGSGASGAPPPPSVSIASQAPARIGECVNMANHLEAPNEGDWGRAIVDDDFQIIAAAGFETVRIPVRFSGHAALASPWTIDPVFIARIDHLVATARAANLRVILDLHNYDALYADPAANVRRFAGLWRQIAEHFRNADDRLWFELANEPHDRLTNANLLETIRPALAAIRETNPARKIVVGGETWSGIDSLATLPLPRDPNLIVTFHYYEPFAFTHQGASWVSPPPPIGRGYPQAGDTAALAADVGKAKAFMARTGVPVFMGEYGAIDAISVARRTAYYGAVHDAFKAASVDGCIWGYTNSFAFRTGAAWSAPLLRAIGL